MFFSCQCFLGKQDVHNDWLAPRVGVGHGSTAWLSLFKTRFIILPEYIPYSFAAGASFIFLILDIGITLDRFTIATMIY